MIRSIINGVKAYFDAFSIISKLNLWKYFAVPILISLSIGLTVTASVYYLSSDIGYYISQIWPWEFGKSTFEFISNLLSGIAIVAVGLILYKHIVLALSAPFMGPVSEKIEKHISGERIQFKKSSMIELLSRGIRISLRNLSRELILTVIILLFSFIPLIGLFSSLAIFFVQAYYAGFGNMDYTLERHFTYKESICFVKKNKGVAIGNGLVFTLLALIPVIGVIIVLPLSVTAATRETIKKI
jgi:CysZ protein